MPSRPELMSPAGGWPQLNAAIEAGADAVYFGLNHFSARAKVGFELSELDEVMKTLHRRSVKGFVTFNTLVFDHEIDAAAKTIDRIASANVDAIIVQDVGVARLARRIAPELAIHGSTQMSVTSAQGVELAATLGCTRVVLGRELSLKDIREIASQTDVELECFVHGALCVSYSGQCFSSEAWGGRSANRGKCAQACRLSYDLIVDGEHRDLGADRYLLSPGDLYTIDQIPELIEIGVACLKIEGRYKDAHYVAATTRAYREAIDRAMAGMSNEEAPSQRQSLEQLYSRGLGAHFMSGVDHQKVVVGRAPRHRGTLVGTVVAVDWNSVEVRLQHVVSPGDGVVFDAADWRSPDEPEEGGCIYTVRQVRNEVACIEFEHGKIRFDRIRVGDLVWRTHQPSLMKTLKPITNATKPVFTRPVDYSVDARIGKPLQVEIRHSSNLNATFVGSTTLEPATKRALDDETLSQQLGRLGGTPFHLGKITRADSDAVFVPTSVLNEARRQLVQSLLRKLEQHKFEKKIAKAIPSFKHAVAPSRAKADTGPPDKPKLHLLVRSSEQMEAAIQIRPDSITLDFLDLYGLRPSIKKIQQANIVARVASPRVLKPSEQKLMRLLLLLDCEILVRSGGLLHDLLKAKIDRERLIGDFSLNASNRLAVETFRQMGLRRITPTYDLNATQIAELALDVGAAGIEAIAYSHLPVFHTEHCVFCRFLSNGTSSRDCGHPCEKHQIAVRDTQGREHPVMADVGCRNTVFGAEAQTNAKVIRQWQAAGISEFRIEFVYQTPVQIFAIADAFRGHLDGDVSQHELTKICEQNSPQQTTEGSLFVPKDFKNLVQLK